MAGSKGRRTVDPPLDLSSNTKAWTKKGKDKNSTKRNVQTDNKTAEIELLPTTSYRDFLSNTMSPGEQQYSHPMVV